MARESTSQKKTIGRVMHEFKHGELKSHGRKVRSPKQAVAIGLSEAGASNRKSAGGKRTRRAPTRQTKKRG
ncbi:MAG TPA: DUF6496 domain-containing protein [Beijerinckiaceae bacterium]|nr:DUF6496 domain-containing protein [Beijerinckiaceae bacterium]